MRFSGSHSVTHTKAAKCDLMLGKALPLEANDGGMMPVDAGYHLPLRSPYCGWGDLYHLRLRNGRDCNRHLAQWMQWLSSAWDSREGGGVQPDVRQGTDTRGK